MIRGNHPGRSVEPEYSVETLHTLGSLKHYEAATRRAREVLIQPGQGHQHAGEKATVLPRPDLTVPTVNDAESVYDTERIIAGGFPHVASAWLLLFLWACGISVITFLLVIAAVLVAQLGSAVL